MHQSDPPPNLVVEVPDEPPLCRAAVQSLFPGVSIGVIDPLARIWDEVVRRIVSELITLVSADSTELHIDVREDMVVELAKMQVFLAEAVIKKRTEARDLASINPDEERFACLGAAGTAAITDAAQLYYEDIWRDLVVNRWGPRSKRALEREANPPATKLPIKQVEKNHFIPKWFIRDQWARNGEITLWRWTEEGWGSRVRAFGKWGFRPKLYSDRLEAYLSLLEGDAKEPVQKLLERLPLNQPQRAALIGFFVVQVIRNPFFIDIMRAELAADPPPGGAASLTPQQIYETLHDNNEFYDSMARPLMWSRWAIVRSEAPLFVLPDRFSAQGGLYADFRIIAPLTPHHCFVTLSKSESEKRLIPFWLEADPELAARISGLLVRTAKHEFVADPDFRPDQADDGRFSEVLAAIEVAIDASVQRPRFE